jgi:capsular exopolysaccharide synthesis family protein
MADNRFDDVFGDVGEGVSHLLRWREYIHIFYERKWILITTFVVVVVCSVVWNMRQIPVYRASAMLHVDMFASKILDLPDPFTSGTPAYMFDQYINTQIRALKSKIFIEKVVQSLKESDSPDAKLFLKGASDPVGAILSCMDVSPIENSRLIKITVQNRVPEVTALLANAVAEQFIKQDLNRRMNASLSAVQWLKEQADTQEIKIKKAEQAIQDYREKCKMVSLEQKQDIVVQKLKSISEALTHAETTRMQAQTRWKNVLAVRENDNPIESIPAVSSDPLVIEAKGNLNRINGELESLRRRYKSKHPAVIKAVAEQKEAGRKYVRAMLDAVQRIGSDFELAKDDVKALQSKLKEQENLALKLSRMMVEYNTLKRDVETDKQLYQSILVRMKESDLAGKLESTNLRISDLAYVPKSPFKPDKKRNVINASGVGFVLGCLLVVLVNMMDDRVRRIEDFEISLGVPVLAMIPKVELNTSAERAAASFNNEEFAVAEAFRGFYAGLMLESVSRDAKVIMVVSASASEGKSLVSSNLASIFAQNGKRTLLIDGDLRRPSLHKLFEVDAKEGLPQLIMETAAWEEALTNTGQPRLDLLTGRVAPSGSPSRLIASSSMNSVLEEARRRYDRIIVDCPPLFGVSDPLVLLPKVDGVIFVALYNKTHRRAISEACQKLIHNETPLLGAVINGVELSSHSYYYHRYGYNHYYGEKRGENELKI